MSSERWRALRRSAGHPWLHGLSDPFRFLSRGPASSPLDPGNDFNFLTAPGRHRHIHSRIPSRKFKEYRRSWESGGYFTNLVLVLCVTTFEQRLSPLEICSLPQAKLQVTRSPMAHLAYVTAEPIFQKYRSWV